MEHNAIISAVAVLGLFGFCTVVVMVGVFQLREWVKV